MNRQEKINILKNIKKGFSPLIFDIAPEEQIIIITDNIRYMYGAKTYSKEQFNKMFGKLPNEIKYLKCETKDFNAIQNL